MKTTTGIELNDKVIEFLKESEQEHPVMDALCEFFGRILPKKMKQLDKKFDELLKEDENAEPLDVVTLHFQDSFITFSRW